MESRYRELFYYFAAKVLTSFFHNVFVFKRFLRKDEGANSATLLKT